MPEISQNTRPNIIFIVADDLGYADLGCYGARAPVSPVLDGLAAGGMCFTQGYANSPVCSPTRFALMTARYQYRLRGAAEEPISSKSRGSTTLGLPPEHPSLPSLLKAGGYRTALVGKWHLGYAPHFSPILSGYEEFFGLMSGGVDYFTHCDSRGTHDLWAHEKAALGQVAEVNQDGYLTDLLSARAVDFVKRQSTAQPFFLSLHYTAPHWPWESRDDAAVAVSAASNLFHTHGGSIHTYRKMIGHMDEGIGQLVDALRAAGQLDNTLIVFTSDNGGERFSDNWPLVGGKMDLTEGGIRVPYIAHWPAHIAAGGVSEQQCLTMDWSATMLAAAGVAAHPDYPLDGISLMPTLANASHTFARPMAWRMNHRGQRALRSGNFKYLRVDGYDYLFDLTQDERERANLIAHEPERAAALRAQYEAWEATMPPIPSDATVSLGYGAAQMPQR